MKTTLEAIEKRDYCLCCDGFLCWNDSERLSLQTYHTIYEKHESIGLTCYLFEEFETEENTYLSSDKTWGYIYNVLFSVLNKYLTPSKNTFWYHIRIEAIE